MKRDNQPDDVFVWPCGVWCYRDEVTEAELTLMDESGDLYEVLYTETPEWTYHMENAE